VFIERGGRVAALGQLAPDEHFYRVAAYVADTRAGRMLSPQYPVVLVDLAGGERFTALTPPLSPEGTVINIRRWQVRRYDLAQLQTLGTFGAPPADAALVAVLAAVLAGQPWALFHRAGAALQPPPRHRALVPGRSSARSSDLAHRCARNLLGRVLLQQ
jgi:hypothetical protein